jgi:hypothetical protein
MNSFRRKLLLIIVFIAVTVSGCATSPEPYEYGGFDQELQTGPGELKEGPGLLSGDDGVFTIYRKPAATEEESAKEDRRKDQ